MRAGAPNTRRSWKEHDGHPSVAWKGLGMVVDIERSGHVALVTMNRPDVLNAFNTEQLQALLHAFQTLREDTAVRVIIVTGAGDRAFAAGADIAEMREKNPSQALEFATLGHTVCQAIASVPPPVIAAVNGVALGGGCEIALASDIRIASENALFGQPEVTLGIPPGWGATQRLPRLVGTGVAKEMILTGRRITSDEALRIGLVSAVHPHEDLMSRAHDMAEQIAAAGPVAVRLAKDLVNRSLDLNLDDGLAYEARAFALAFDSADQKEGMGAFLEKRKPDYVGR